ncbi:Spermine synthase [Chloroherpeton thalassium ATCC 35110]|uniref:Polyamine aminopropyltransferase n=1 Tax=Chloroherpeton thalassium (strain ATCC 35110 / GB-78) TaxID=517418 RepID=B3QYM0_CHLT3|nr:polyamine aminopropyltransferase [Chloroherpeton thalassium]ACF13648.1 Spermine synthase [Chloroherpeton thalassium ATCC 35110]
MEHSPERQNAPDTPFSPTEKKNKSLVLKLSIFATGLSGIVAEYIMATLATYLIGNAVVQWTLTISVMLFAMGVGSRQSKFTGESRVLDMFILTELLLSLLVALSATTAYFLTAYIRQAAFVIYPTAFVIGFLIGMELPLATRLNDRFEELRINISSVMEKDYFGALFGGIFFAFFALPHLGLTYTPIVLGSLNFLIAAMLFFEFRESVHFKQALFGGAIGSAIFLVALFFLAKPIVLFGEQQRYQDRVVYEEQTVYQKIVVTEWRGYYWLYLNNNEQFSSYDEERYHEPLVHPAMRASVSRRHILILGGGDGLALREILKYPDVETITLVDIDPQMTELAKTHPIFSTLNHASLESEKLTVINQDAYTFLMSAPMIYDVVLVDLPDPKSVDLARLYSKEFYELVKKHLAKGGTMVTQATSPSFARKAFLSIQKSVEAAGLPALGYHNHVPTMGEWGWVLGVNLDSLSRAKIKQTLSSLEFDSLDTRFLNHDAMLSMLNFGKETYDDYEEIEPTDETNFAVFHYYRNFGWEIY